MLKARAESERGSEGGGEGEWAICKNDFQVFFSLIVNPISQYNIYMNHKRQVFPVVFANKKELIVV